MIAPQWILTAAHCLWSKSTRDYKVVTGEYDLRVKDAGEEEHQVEKIVVHSKYETGRFDIALIKLRTSTKVRFTNLHLLLHSFIVKI